MKIGERIKAERLAQKMARRDLAERSGVKYPTLAGIENGDQGATTQLHAIAEALNVTARWLETGKAPKHPAPSQAAGQLNEKTRASVEVLLYTLGNLGKPLEMVSDMDLLELAYEVVDADGRDLTPAVKLDLNQKLAGRIREKEASYGNKRGPSEGTGGEAGKPNPRRRGAGKA